MISLEGIGVQRYSIKPSFGRNYSTLRSNRNENQTQVDSSCSDLDDIKRTFPALLEQNKHVTKNVQEATQVLINMYNSLSDSSPVKQYLKIYCLHLLNLKDLADKGYIGDFVDYAMDSKDKKGHPSLYQGNSGCYLFLNLNLGIFYIGSAICLYTRFKSHKVNSMRPERGGDNAFYLAVRELG